MLSKVSTNVFFDVVPQRVLCRIKDEPTTLELFGGFSALPQISLSATTEVRMFWTVHKLLPLVLCPDPLFTYYSVQKHIAQFTVFQLAEWQSPYCDHMSNRGHSKSPNLYQGYSADI